MNSSMHDEDRDVIDERIDALYQLPLKGFVRARNELATNLKTDGNDEIIPVGFWPNAIAALKIFVVVDFAIAIFYFLTSVVITLLADVIPSGTLLIMVVLPAIWAALIVGLYLLLLYFFIRGNNQR